MLIPISANQSDQTNAKAIKLSAARPTKTDREIYICGDISYKPLEPSL